ncbi:phage tail assembly protein [Xanthobacter sp. 126]|uniref:phage tail assembly protein n=1 Tax=Xanthobacter sp. 126 TaxID=1131814 RepID=UPI00045E8E02|nr:phage tail assembly protein [Xanthobacter sp. 126]
MENLPPPIADAPSLPPIAPPAGSPDAARRNGGPAAPVTPAASPQPLPPVATALDFVQRPSRTVPLDYPFVLDGCLIDQITVRRLLTAQVAALCEGGKAPDPFDCYAVMTGLPTPVLRGLDGDDGQAVAEAAFDFLPRLLRDALSA